jgi:hypothetical protein
MSNKTAQFERAEYVVDSDVRISAKRRAQHANVRECQSLELVILVREVPAGGRLES